MRSRPREPLPEIALVNLFFSTRHQAAAFSLLSATAVTLVAASVSSSNSAPPELRGAAPFEASSDAASADPSIATLATLQPDLKPELTSDADADLESLASTQSSAGITMQDDPTAPPVAAPPATAPAAVPAAPPQTPPPAAGAAQPAATETVNKTANETVNGDPSATESSRRPAVEEKVVLSFRETPIEDTVRFIVECTGKVVIVRLSAVKPYKITLINDKPISQHEALDLLFKAFRLNGVGVVETEKEIIIDLLTDLNKIQDPGIVLGADDDVMSLSEDGAIVTKVYQVKLAKAAIIAEQLQPFVPSDVVTMFADENSNRIVLQGNVGLAKRFQLLIDSLDRPMFVNVETRTFRLAYADAATIGEAVQNLFEAGRTPTSGNRSAQQPAGNRGQPGRPTGGARSGESVGTSEQLRVTVMTQINAITVSAEPEILDEVQGLISKHWDVPLSKAEGELYRVYDLAYADPLVVEELLTNMLEGGTSSRAGRGAGGARGGALGGAGGGGITGGGGDGATAAVANIFRIRALPDNRQLVVFSRTPENFSWLDKVVESIDTPTRIGKPVIVELRYANATEVAEQLNALLSEAGSGVSIAGARTGLTKGNTGGISDGLNSGSDTGGARAGGDAEGGGGGGNPGDIQFPWQQGRAGDTDRTPESSIIGKVRIVPIIKQNALSILAPGEMQTAVVEMVAQLDKPGRQVLIAAILASVDLKDEFAWGLRVGRDGITTPLSDNAIGASIENNNTEEGFLSIFDTSVLNVNVSAEAVLQALDQKTNVKILQQPKIFTSDNAEAVFFNGQEIPFISNTNTTDVGGVNNSFEYKPVGVLLNVRPRITPNDNPMLQNVSLEIKLELSNVVPGVTILGGAVLDRRITETEVTLRNGQTVVLSGIRVETQSDVKRKVPLLGDIPGIGDLLFTSMDTADNVSELLAFVTPIIVDNPNENDTNFNQDARRKLDEYRRPLKQLMEEGLREPDFDPSLMDDSGRTDPSHRPGAPDIRPVITPQGAISGSAAAAQGANSPPAPPPPAPGDAPKPPVAAPAAAGDTRTRGGMGR